MRSVTAVATGTLITALVWTGATAVPAAAEPGVGGKFNMWQHDRYEGQLESRLRYDNNLHNDSCSGCDPGPGGNFGDDMSSFVNKTGYWWLIYVDRDTYGDVFCVRPNSHDADLGNNGFSNLEDEISSVVRKTDPRTSVPACDRKGRKLGYPN